MPSLTADSLLQLKVAIEGEIEATLATLKSTDSQRLLRNKINGCLIAI